MPRPRRVRNWGEGGIREHCAPDGGGEGSCSDRDDPRHSIIAVPTGIVTAALSSRPLWSGMCRRAAARNAWLGISVPLCSSIFAALSPRRLCRVRPAWAQPLRQPVGARAGEADAVGAKNLAGSHVLDHLVVSADLRVEVDDPHLVGPRLSIVMLLRYAHRSASRVGIDARRGVCRIPSDRC